MHSSPSEKAVFRNLVRVVGFRIVLADGCVVAGNAPVNQRSHDFSGQSEIPRLDHGMLMKILSMLAKDPRVPSLPTSLRVYSSRSTFTALGKALLRALILAKSPSFKYCVAVVNLPFTQECKRARAEECSSQESRKHVSESCGHFFPCKTDSKCVLAKVRAQVPLYKNNVAIPALSDDLKVHTHQPWKHKKWRETHKIQRCTWSCVSICVYGSSTPCFS